MKKLLLSIFIMLTSITLLFAGTYSGGSGTSGDPYQIATLNDLSTLCQTTADWDKFFIQVTDIDASTTQYWDDSDDNSDGDLYNDANDATSAGSNEGFSPIGNFSNKFKTSYDGDGYIIDGLFINRPNIDYVGLFGRVYGTSSADALVKDLGLLNVNITGQNYTGSLSGEIGIWALVENCYCIEGTVTGANNTGGLTGRLYTDYSATGTLKTSFTDVSVSGCGYTGGIIGSVLKSEVYNCYSLGSVSKNLNHTSETSLGGLAGSLSSATIINCYSSGSIDEVSGGMLTTGGFVGSSVSSTVTNSFWDTQTSLQTTSAAGTGKTTLEMKTQSTFTDNGWDFTDEGANGVDDIWSISALTNDGYPYLEGNQPPEAPTPITLKSFTALEKNGSVEITWETATETDNSRFLIYRNGTVIGSVEGAGTCSDPHNYSFIDCSVVPNVSYTYVLADVDYANQETRYNDKSVTLIITGDIVETSFVMNAAYPNPFNPSVTINYQLLSTGHIHATIYNAQGTLVEELINADMTAGYHNLTWNATNKPSGIYIISMRSGGITHNQKIVLMK